MNQEQKRKDICHNLEEENKIKMFEKALKITEDDLDMKSGISHHKK